MAIQNSIIKLTGQMDGISFYKTKDGYNARRKGGIDANRLKTDPAFKRTRENGVEFGKAGLASKHLRNAIRQHLQQVKDPQMSNRLTREMMRVLKSDGTSLRGERTPAKGDLLLLNGFEFNENGTLAATLYAPYTSSINRATGALGIQFPVFSKDSMIAQPEGATHFRFSVIGVEIDLDSGNSVVDIAESNLAVIDSTDEPAQNLAVEVTPGSTNALFLLLGVQFSQLVNGVQYPLRNGAFNALAIVDVNNV